MQRSYPVPPRAIATVGLLLAGVAVTGIEPAAAQHPGPGNTLTDVPGIAVGHETRTADGYRTGTTVVLTPEGATASVDVRGGAPGTRETDLLRPGGLVTQAHAIVLSGGSAYGLDAATGVMRWLEERGHGYPVPGGVVPIVPAAILFDLGRGGDFSKRPDADFGYRAADAATREPVAMGRVGAGTGARYGLGSASVVLPSGHVVAALVAVNSFGSPVDPSSCLPYAAFLELGDEFGLTTPDPAECAAARSPGDAAATGDPGEPGRAEAGSSAPGETAGRPPFNTTIAVVATDAPLDQTSVRRMAEVANAGLARAINPIHGLFDGDAVFGLATSAPSDLSPAELQAVHSAAADVLGRAVVHAILAEGGYCDRYPSACGDRNR